MTTIFIFGTDHHYQCGDKKCTDLEISVFDNELRNLCTLHNIQRIAEEMSVYGRTRYGVQETIGARVARDLNIEHQEVDLSPEDRKSICLTDGPLFGVLNVFRPADSGKRFRNLMNKLVADVRERVWAARIIEKEQWPVLFICGADHVDSFSKIMTFLEFEQEILHKDYKP